MRACSRLALVVLAVAACGKKDRGAETGSAAPSANVAKQPWVPDTVALPTLAAGSRAENVPMGPTVVASATSIVVEGMAMVVVADGKVDPVELEGGADGLKIPRLAAWAAQWAQLPEAATFEAFLVGVDPALSSALPLQLVMSLKPSKLRRFAFLVRTPDGLGAVPIELPDGPPPAPPPTANPEDAALGMVVALTPERVVVWSMSMLEGTLQQPKAVFEPASDAAWLTHLRDSLVDVRQRRWGGGLPRPDYQKSIVVMVDPSVASGDLVNTIAAVRVDAKGEALFPDVRLAVGFETSAPAEATKAPGPAAPPANDDDARRRKDDVALQAEAEAMAMAMALVGESEGAHGDLSGEMSARRPGADLDSQIAAVKEGGTFVAAGRTGGIGARVDGSGDEQLPTGRITITGKTAMDDTSLDADAVLRKVMSAYMAGLKRCYKNLLKTDPTARGGVALSLTVNEAGRTVNAKARGFSSSVDTCIDGLMSHWVFAVPKDADGEATEASFQIKLGLVPD